MKQGSRMKAVITAGAVIGLVAAAVAARAAGGAGVDQELAQMSVGSLLPLGMAVAIFMTRKTEA